MSNFNQRPNNRFNDMEGYRSATNSILSAAYMWMCVGLLVTGVVAYATASSPAVLSMIYSNRMMPWILMFAQIGLVMYLSSQIFKMSSAAATGFFMLYAALLGLTLSILLFAYTGAQLSTAFFVTAGMFGAASLFGKVTKQDLTSMGHFLFMGVIGIIIASVVNMFMRNSMLDYIISIAGVVIFTALTAYDTQKIVGWQNEIDSNDRTMREKLAILGALTLYIDFINMFLFMLRVLNRRN
jgi:uncharacterized protein